MSDAAEPEVLTMPEVAAVLRVNVATCYRQIKKGTFPLPLIQIGSKRMVSRRILDRYLAGELEVAS